MDQNISIPGQAADVTSMTAAIVSAYVSANRVQTNELPEMIRVVHAALSQLGQPTAPVQQKQKQEPAVAIRRSVTPDYIVCLEDGKKLKMLKRHLRTTYGMSPDEYRAKWGLPAEYPMVAPNYATRRSEFAKHIGLGRKKAA
ncbi:MucR family transcriptional regulator [Azospirillum sp. YIM DDC1]|uniref:MucR family transcriptional regulator n=1 Tax=Azospirillum aestuarii TaxID=2802052 RepID=A0ABS1HSF3_9PROT|nr:MucR family transcriptional regulator [Azospirillum aestuarii]MBK4717604.1 MucR family transcriptional regulator [Azospirillum aestuarii]